MSEYIINEIGSAEMSIPDGLSEGDTLRFNITNSDEATAYTGTIMNWTVPMDLVVQIDAYGSRGSYGNLYTYGLTDTSRSGNGAHVGGVFNLSAGSELLILVGQHGKDAMTGTGSTRDGVSGCGGGGTFVVLKTDESTGSLFVGSDTNGSKAAYGGWYVSPLVIAAGGNGSKDNGYSGTGPGRGGLSTTYTSKPSYSSSLTGGGFDTAYGTNNSNSSSYGYGLSFLNGGLGSQYAYSRSSMTPKAGFGGGGGNSDDGYGGGGGGYYGGIQSAAACSYVSPDAESVITGEDDINAGDGYVIITIIEGGKIYSPEVYMRDNGEIHKYSDMKVSVNGELKTIKNFYSKMDGKWVKMAREIVVYEAGKSWTQSNIDSGSFYSVYNANGIWVACSGGNGLYYSTDGKVWTQSNITNDAFHTVYNANGIWVAGNNNGLYYSTDGKAWTQSNITTGGFRRVYNANGIWVACDADGIYYSMDGKSWTKSNMTYGTYHDAYNANDIWVAGGSGSLYYSTDGKVWTQSNIDNGSTTIFFSVYNADDIWVAGSDNGLYYSTDGKVWIQSNIDNGSFNTVYNANGIWVACSDGNGLYYSETRTEYVNK